MTRISLMNLMMHGITSPTIEQTNTLSKTYDESEYYDVEDGLEPEPEYYSAEEQEGGNKKFNIELKNYLIGQNEFYNKKHIIKKKKKRKTKNRKYKKKYKNRKLKTKSKKKK